MRKKNVETLPIRSFNDKVASNFEIVAINGDGKGQGLNVEAHRHDYYHILYIKQGLGKHVIDFKTYQVKPNSIFFVSPGQVHSLAIDSSVEAYVLTFNADFYALNNNMQSLLDYPFFHSITNAPVVYLPTHQAKIQATLDEIFMEYTLSEKGKETILRALLEVLLVRAARMYQTPANDDAPAYLTFQLRKLEALIDAHFKEHKLLNDYAEMMHISPKHLNSLCKKGLNKTVTNLIHERTLTEAKRLLLFTDNAIAEIAFELGFADKSYFMRFFKKHTGVTGDTYRKEGKNR